MKTQAAEPVREGRDKGRGGAILLGFASLVALYVLSTGPVIKLAVTGKMPLNNPQAIYKPLDILYNRVPIIRPAFDWYLHDVWKIGAGTK